MIGVNNMLRCLFIVSALVVAKGSVAQTPVTTSDSLVGKCVEIQPAKGALFARWPSPRFARLEATSWRNYPDRRWMRVATPIRSALDSATRRYEREANWRVEGDSMRLSFSTGFTVLDFAFALAGSDALQGSVWIWNDDGPTTTFGGFATLSFPPCARLLVP